MLGSVVLVMESMVMGFALLIAKNSHSGGALLIGGIIALFLLLTPILLRSNTGWIIGTLLQFTMLGYGLIVTMMWFLGGIFLALWAAAYFIGRAGEAKKRDLLDKQ
jgi:hypothetical protein